MGDPIRILNHAETLLARSRGAFSRTSKAGTDRCADRGRVELMTDDERAYYEAARAVMLQIRLLIVVR